MGNFYGLETGVLSNDNISLEYLVDAGPRIVKLFHHGTKNNLLAEIPDSTHITQFGQYFFRGGHRLWHAPEDIIRTYIPDNDPITITHIPNGVILTQPVEIPTGIQKSIQVTLHPGKSKVTLCHQLINTGLWPIQTSAWALTQFPLGGIAMFPQTTSKLDNNGLLPNRNLSLWSYTSVTDPRLILADDLLLIKASPNLPPIKIGYTNRSGWIGYIVNSTLIVKSFQPQPDLYHPDFGCNVETYCGDQFIELETLSPYQMITPGQSIQHTETWEIIPDLDQPHNISEVRQLINSLSL